MMMNQGESTGSVASLEKHQMNDSQQIHPSSYFSPNCAVASWNTQAENHSSRENGVLSTSGYNHDQLVDPTSQIAQDGSNVAPIVSSSSVPPNVAQGYNGYAAHPNTDPYGYSSTSYAAYYNQYQHQPSQYEQQPSQHQQQPSQYEQQPNQYQQQPNQYQQQPSQYQPQPSQYQQQPSQYQQQPSQYEQQPNQYQQQPSQFEQQPSQYQPQPSQYEPQPSQYEQQPSQQQPNQYQQHTSQYQQQPSQFQQQPSQYQQQPSQYQQQSTQSYPHQVGAYQNTGAPHQPLSSFQNTGSYAGPASYSSTYHNAGDYQTSGSYTSGSYGTQDTQTNAWPGGQYATYSSHQYQNYTQDSNSAYSSTSAVATSQYQQHCKQWEEYYNQTQTEVSCAPGTEKPPVSVASGVSSYVPSGSIAHTTPNSQMPTAYTPSWRPESSSSEMNSMQPVGVSGSTPEWQHGVSVFQTDATNSVQTHAQKPLEVIPAFEKFQNQQNSSFSQGSTAMYPVSYQVSQSLQSFQTVLQPSEPLDSNKASKLIPTNPRIASNLPLSLLRSDKDRSVTSGTAKPAYVSIPLPKPDEKVKSHDEADTMLKPGMFPKSLRGYVERALARCKSDGQKSACQAIMKEVITLATADGTLYTKDWDTEPLFPMPNTDSVDKYDKLFPPLTSAMPKSRSPSRRAKSRWEPAPEEKMVHKSASISPGTAVHGSWNNKKVSGGKTENNDYSGSRFSYTYQKNFSKNVTRPAKRQRLGEDLKAADDGESSSDSDKEQSLTKYYSAATALADTPEEKKRREDRSKRFDKGHGNRAGKNNFRAKDVGPGKLYTKRASALVLSRTFEESGSRAVEDIDWNALTVKGTCQEIEKRYLRLTSAPDPATVRPEEVLEKSLLMVQNSQKNYLYKCDQLKSIRQDLTVQHIRNELTVKVYETHARFAIEVGDLPEYNQCQSQLKTLYAEGIVGCHMEFAAYNLLCVIMHSNNNRDLVSAMSRLPANAKKDKGVKHALSVRSAVTSGNYVMFFRLYKTAPNLNTFLMDLYVEKMRYAAVKCITRSYRPTVPVSYLSQILGFANNALPTSEEDDEKELDGVEECMEWLKAHGASIISDSSGETSLDTKVSVSTLFMPDPEDAVSHGDATLAVNDFLTRSIAQVN